jgi:hypothetical protein
LARGVLIVGSRRRAILSTFSPRRAIACRESFSDSEAFVSSNFWSANFACAIFLFYFMKTRCLHLTIGKA